MLVLLLAGCAAAPTGEGPRFALMGDTPYSESEVRRLDALIADLNREPLAFVAHIGDITSGRGPCTDEWLEARKSQLARLRMPLVLLPGDNEWTDCHRVGFDPLERLEKWRKLFCLSASSFSFSLERQPGEYCEHVRWQLDDAMFIALNVPGSNNNLGRTAEMDAEHERRMSAVFEWLDESIAAAEARGAAHVVVLMHADPFLQNRRDGFARLRNVLVQHAKWLQGKLVLVHGDSHIYRDDEPVEKLRRIEVFGSPFVAWLRGTLAGGELVVQVGGQY